MRTGAVVLGVIAVALATSQSTGATTKRCSRALPSAPAGLAASVVVTTSCGRYRLVKSRRAVYLGPRTLPVPSGASYWPDLTWQRHEHGHLVVGRGVRRLWRSRGMYPERYPASIGLVVTGADALAFSYYRGTRSRLYVARYGGGEHAVARGEIPVGFLASGELVTVGHGLVVRGPDGSFRRLVAAHAVDPRFDRASRTTLFRFRDRVSLFDGRRIRVLPRLSRLGLDRRASTVEQAGALVAVHDQRRLVVLDRDGRVFASTRLPGRPATADGVSSAVVANPSSTLVAFAATRGNNGLGSRGHETVYVLRRGARSASAVYRARLRFRECERGAELAWHGRWLLYGPSERRAAVVDAWRRRAPIRLGAAIARLPGGDRPDFFQASWA